MAFHDLSVTRADGGRQPLGAYRGKVLLIVNVASRCGFTPQYSGLEALYRRYRDSGFEILAFPCNQFGGQEPGSAQDIAEFCSTNYAVSFPVLAKIKVNGPDTDPLYAWLKQRRPGLLGTRMIKWNFTKFLLNREGKVVARHGPTIKPEAMAAEIEALL